MKLLGFIGGMNWRSTIEYYKTINYLVNQKLGGNHSARVIIYSVDFEEILTLEMENNWGIIKDKMVDISKSLESAGAKGIVICSNTMHLIAEDLQKMINIPIINVIDATAEEIKKNKINSIGLLGTKFTMEGEFYKKRLENKHRLRVLVPDLKDIELINNIIYKELAYGEINLNSKKEIIRIIERLSIDGAEGIILGCTELPMIINSKENELPLFDTLSIHMAAAMNFSLKD
ncbi:MAG: putative racemase [Candidatus Methanofastidiosum methylothiophilum]|uniref:Putative racemase n=1 Tax=Candidatus Methanofastidiosum methylothiophilum TaxID=1705564 RepID=A0A150IRA0_9EURY|nr:MAG: putative racemase [Candidatus Methanofastidiosum methylthiophilus]KYC47496.1 MAG: putative racemase [Candidatus Methanofastidiosum methylthiophilus]KYC50396.1 MAG: putative racemase [Candidatus Methanofastidiosum methylthiophilus]